MPQLLGQGESRVVLTRSSAAEDADFSYCPAIPNAGTRMSFRYEGMAEPASVTWSFGDGETAEGLVVQHRFDAPGDYAVHLDLQSETGQAQSNQMQIRIVPRATILSLTESVVILSAGSQNGLSVGDRLGIYDPQAVAPVEALIEIVELIDEDGAAARMLQHAESLDIGSQLVPIDVADDPPCFESFENTDSQRPDI